MKKNFQEKKIEILSQHLENLLSFIENLWQFLPIAVCNISPQGFILDVNRFFEDFSFWSILEIAGRPLSFIFPQKAALEIIGETFKKGLMKDYETFLLTKEKRKIAIALYSQIRKDKEGNIIGFFLALIDIRKSKKFREELSRQVTEKTKELQKKIKELEIFSRLSVGRELKMIELKKEIKKLKELKEN